MNRPAYNPVPSESELAGDSCSSFSLAWSGDSVWPREPLSLALSPIPETIDRSVRKRQIEYTAGRRCAARALEEQGASLLHVGTRDDRQPVWPTGYIGSITHSEGYAWAVVAPQSDCKSIGIDSEPMMDTATLSDVKDAIMSDYEANLRPLNLTIAQWVTLVFSAKESVYKCLYPVLGTPFNFHDVMLHSVVERGHGQYCIEAEMPTHAQHYESRLSVACNVGHDRVHTLVKLI